MSQSPPRKRLRLDSFESSASNLCESRFCQTLAKFDVPEGDFGLVAALSNCFQLNSHLKTVSDQDDPCYHIGTITEIAARPNCSFCRIVMSALNIGSDRTKVKVKEEEELHVQWVESEAKFDLVTVSVAGEVSKGVLALGVRIVICEESNHSEAAIYWGRNPSIDGFNQDQVRHWLSMCEDKHHSQCGLDPGKIAKRLDSLQDQEFRLIDVHQDCVVTRPWESRYMALSYVWGHDGRSQSLRHFYTTFTAPGSLGQLRDYLPATIQDAMEFVRVIGEKYLWIDAVCLNQHDAQSMQDGINSMNFVYENALATIIAADGSDASAGLRRLHLNLHSSSQRAQTIKPGFQLMAIGALDVHLKTAKWSSRAWTFQEQLLSRRTITFVNEQVYFRCRQCIWSEDTFTDRFPDDRVTDEWLSNLMVYLASETTGSGLIEEDPQPLPWLTTMLEYYSMRELTYETDAINAVSGLLNSISTRMKSELLQGLPIVALDYMLTFQVYAYRKVQSGNELHRARRRRCFPSWSWAGWDAFILWNNHPDISPDFPETFNHWLDQGTWIVWFKSRGLNRPVPVLESGSLQAGFRDEEDVGYSKTGQSEPSTRFGFIDTSKTTPASLTSINPVYSNQELLRFYTVTITLTISLNIPQQISWPKYNDDDDNKFVLHPSDIDPSAALYDNEDEFCGLLLFDIADFLGQDREYELVLLSDSQNSLFRRMTVPDLEHSNPFVSYQGHKQDWKLYWVMLLIWNDGVAERRGLGQVLRSSVQNSLPPGPQWKEIVLG